MSQLDQDTNGATASESSAPLGADNGAAFDPGKVWNDTVHGVQEQWNQFTDNASHAVQGVVDGWNQWTASPEGQQAQDFVSNVIHTAEGPFNDSVSDPNGDFGSAVRGLDDLVHDAPVVEPDAADAGVGFPPVYIPARFDDQSIADTVPAPSEAVFPPEQMPRRFDPESIADPVPATPFDVPDQMPRRFDPESISDPGADPVAGRGGGFGVGSGRGAGAGCRRGRGSWFGFRGFGRW